jgi:ribosomal-protein-alanine N-acetyltransferase
MYLETERLIIRDWRLEDAAAAFSVYGDPEVMRYVGTGQPHESLEQTRVSLRRSILRDKDKAMGFWAIDLKMTGELIGGGLLKYLPDHSDVEVGYHLGKKWWGKGYATEIARALVKYGFEGLNLQKIVGVTYLENVPSQRILEKAGLAHQGSTTYVDIPVELFVLERAAWNP